MFGGLPSRELTYPPLRQIWRWFSFSPGGFLLIPWWTNLLVGSSGLVYFAVHPLECEIDLADGYGKLLDRWFLRGDASEGEGHGLVLMERGKGLVERKLELKQSYLTVEYRCV